MRIEMHVYFNTLLLKSIQNMDQTVVKNEIADYN